MTQRKAKKIANKEEVQMINRMISQNRKTKEIVESFDLSKSTVLRIIRKIREDEKYLENFEKKGGQRNPVTLVRDDRMKVLIENYLIQDSSLTQKAIQTKLSTDGYAISQSKISSLIKSMGYSRKRLTRVPEDRNSDRVLEMRRQYAISLMPIQDESMVFLDETGFNLHTSRNYGYSPLNQKAYRIVPSNRGRNTSVLAAISIRGLISYKIISGAFNGEKFAEFIENDLKPCLHANETILIMDNAKFHRSNVVLNMIRQLGLTYKFLPPYSPQINPIEEFFSKFKAIYNNDLSIPSNNDELCEKISNALRVARSSELTGFYRNMKVWLERALQKSQFI